MRMTTPPSKQQQQPAVSGEESMELRKIGDLATAGRSWLVYFTSGLAELCFGVDVLLLFMSAVNKACVCVREVGNGGVIDRLWTRSRKLEPKQELYNQ